MVDSAEAVILDVFRDGYIEDFTRDGTLPDGTPDRILETNALLAAHGFFIGFNVDSHSIMTFDISPYSGLTLSSAVFSAYGGRVDIYTGDPLLASLYSYAGDGVVGLGDFNSSATFLSNMNFPGSATTFPWGTHFQDFNVDVTSGVQALLDSSSPYIEFRLETEQATAYLSAGETSTPDSFGSGGPRRLSIS